MASAPASPRYEMQPWTRASAYAGAPSPRKVLVAVRAVRALRPKALSVGISLLEELPFDLMVQVVLVLFAAWPCWPRLLCVSAGFAEAAKAARRQTGPGELWTGPGRPMCVPSLQPVVDLSSLEPRPGHLGIKVLGVRGADVRDLRDNLVRVRARAYAWSPL